MARFRYLGEPDRPGFVKQMGSTIKIRVRQKNGTTLELLPKTGGKFTPGQDIGYDITDERAIRHLESDTRYERIS